MKHDQQPSAATSSAAREFPRFWFFVGLTLRSFAYAISLGAVSGALIFIMSWTSLGAGFGLAIPLIAGLLASRFPREVALWAALIFGTAFLGFIFNVIRGGIFIEEASSQTALTRALIATAVFYGAFLSGRFASLLNSVRSTR